MPVRAGGPGGNGRKVADGQDRLAAAGSETLRDARRNAQAREPARAAPERDGVEIAGREASLSQAIRRPSAAGGLRDRGQ